MMGQIQGKQGEDWLLDAIDNQGSWRKIGYLKAYVTNRQLTGRCWYQEGSRQEGVVIDRR
jgi:hypothetical protein